MGWVSTIRTLLAAGFYRDNLVKIADASSEAIDSDDHRVCAFVVRDIATDMCRFWDDAVQAEWARQTQEILWPTFYALLDLLVGQHSADEVLAALNRVIETSEAIIRSA